MELEWLGDRFKANLHARRVNIRCWGIMITGITANMGIRRKKGNSNFTDIKDFHAAMWF